jgi:urease accessory protein
MPAITSAQHIFMRPVDAASLESGALYRLMTWLSPAYPTGAFSYSHGLEFAVEAGLVKDAVTLQAWVRIVLESGAGWIDAVLLAAAWRAAAAGDPVELGEVATLAAAWRSTAETALESESQGRAFLSTTRAAWPDPLLDRLAEIAAAHPLPVVVGAAAATQGVPLAAAILAYLQSLAGNLVSAGQRLIPLGQTDGQRTLAALAPAAAAVLQRALEADIETVGSAAPLIECCSMAHETQYTRLFRS